MSSSIASSSAIFVSPSSSPGTANGGGGGVDTSLGVALLLLSGSFAISILLILLCLYVISLCYKAHKHIKKARSCGPKRNDSFVSWDENVNQEQHQRRLKENVNAQNPVSTSQPEISPYGDSDSFEESYSGEDNEEGVDAPTRHRPRARTKSDKKAAGAGRKRQRKEVVERSKETHTVEGGTATSEPGYVNVAHPNMVLLESVEQLTTELQNTSTNPIVVSYQNWPVRHDIVEGISNSSNGSVDLTQRGNTDLDVDQELQQSVESSTHSMKDSDEEVAV